MKKMLLTVCLVLALTVPANAQLMSFTGMLSTADGGVQGTGDWAGNFRIAWTIDEQLDGNWKYVYQLTAASGLPFGTDQEPGNAVSHVIFDISDNATREHFFNFDGTDVEFGSWDTDSLFSANTLKLDYGDDAQLEWSFFSTKAPTWGDFFAKGGLGHVTDIENTAWNAGYNLADPLAVAPTNGSYLNKILRPDTYDTPVPEPGTLSLLGLGLIGIGTGVRRRRRRS